MRQEVEIRTPGDWIKGGLARGVINTFISVILVVATQTIFGESTLGTTLGFGVGFIAFPAISCWLYKRSVMDGYKSVWLQTHAVGIALMFLFLGSLAPNLLYSALTFAVGVAIAAAMFGFAYKVRREYEELAYQHHEYEAESMREEAINVQTEAILRAEQIKKQAENA